MPSNIFVIDSSPAVRRLIELIAKQEGCEAQGFQDGPAALQATRQTSPNLIFVDYHLENITFSGFCKEIYKLDNLAETFIISLISASDHIDETHLRSLGVKAFLHKPFQPANVVTIIKDLEAEQASRTNGAKKITSRAWPPVSSSTESDDETPNNDNPTEQQETAAIVPQPQSTKAPPVPTIPAPTSTAEPEETMKGLFGQVLHSMSERTQKNIADQLPQMGGENLASLEATSVEASALPHMDASLSEERLTHMLEPLIMTALPRILSREMSLLQPIIRQSVSEIASPLLKERIDQFVREEINAVRAALSDIVREQLGSIEGLVKEEIQHTAAKQTSEMAEALVRATAQEQVELAVLKLVPNLAEEQIKAEITRLTRAA